MTPLRLPQKEMGNYIRIITLPLIFQLFKCPHYVCQEITFQNMLLLFYKFLFFFSDFLEIQRKSFYFFLNFQLGEEIASFQPLVQKLNLNIEDDEMNILHQKPEGRTNTTMAIYFLYENYKFLRPTLNIEESIILSKTYCCHFYIPIQYFAEIQWVFLGTLPLLTRRGHFIINGTPRVILHQIVRSPGIYFHKELQKKSSRLFYAEIISQRGPWVRLEIDKKKEIWISFQTSTKIPLHRFFQNFSQKFIDQNRNRPEGHQKFSLPEGPRSSSRPLRLRLSSRSRSSLSWPRIGMLSNGDLLGARESPEGLVEGEQSDKALSNRNYYTEKRTSYIKRLQEKFQQYNSLYSHGNYPNIIGKNYRSEMSSIRIHADFNLGQEGRLRLNKRLGLSLKTLTLTPIDFLAISNILSQLDTSNIVSTDDIDDLKNRRLKTIGELLQNQFARGLDRLQKTFVNFFKKDSLNLLKNLEHSRPTLQYKKEEQNVTTLGEPSPKKVITFMNRIHNCFPPRSSSSSRSSLTSGKRSGRPSGKRGPLMSQKQLQFLLTKLQFKRGIVFSSASANVVGGSYYGDLLSGVKLKQQSQSMSSTFNTKSIFSIGKFSFHYPINSTLKEFFHSHQLSQYLDQSNPLAEITHKRRLSCLGSGGVNRDTAGMEIRGIHQSHYGRICPIETPEGKNAGLVNSLTTTVHLNNKGFLETPYLEIYKQHSQNQKRMFIFSAEDQGPQTKNIFLSQKLPKLRNISVGISQTQNFQKCLLNSINLVAFNPQQFLSIATTCIPFIEHDDANRALMGSNMQRQALPLISLEPPFVTTFNSFRIFSDLKDIPTNSDTGLVLYASQQKISIYQKKNLYKVKEVTFWWQKQIPCIRGPAPVVVANACQKVPTPFAHYVSSTNANVVGGGEGACRQQPKFTKQNISFLKFRKNFD